MRSPGLRRRDSAMETTELNRIQRRGSRRNPQDNLDVKILGVCTGSGLNELECALVQYRQDAPNASLRVELLKYDRLPVAPVLRMPILNSLREGQKSSPEGPQFNALLGQMFAGGIKTFCETHKIALTSIDLVGTHSPTTLTPTRCPETNDPSLHPLGWNVTITAATGITAVFDFAIIEGAVPKPRVSPIAFVDRMFLRHPSKFRACLNIGELTNINFIPPLVDGNERGTISHDCGPGSLLIDYAMRYCTSNDHSEDYSGTHAASGKVNQDIVDRFLYSHDYLRRSPSLSIAREMFGDHDAQRLIDECLFQDLSEADTIATITRITAANILQSYQRLLAHYFPSGQNVDEIFVCGPSARNLNIIDYLESKLPESVITKPLDDIGLPGDTNQAVCYAHLALEAALGQATLPTPPATAPSKQADDAFVRGKILRGTRWDDVAARILHFSGGKQLSVTKDVRWAGNLETAIKGLGLR